MIPPTTFGTFFVVKSVRPGSTRSGENARKKSSPQTSPDDSSTGWISSRVVPGYVVDSSTTRCPLRSRGAICATALFTMDRSGSRWRDNGVGSAIRIASASRRTS